MPFTPCLQYQYASGKNTADIALALDAQEPMFDGRADTFCLVTSDADFAYLWRKLRERGATVHIVGEAKTPDALHNASDQFSEWSTPEVESIAPVEPIEKPAARAAVQTPPQPSKDAPKPAPKQWSEFVVEADALPAGDIGLFPTRRASLAFLSTTTSSLFSSAPQSVFRVLAIGAGSFMSCRVKVAVSKRRCDSAGVPSPQDPPKLR